MKKASVGKSSTPEFPELEIPFTTVCGVLSMARQFDAKEGVTEPDPDSNPTDDDESAVLEDHADDPVRQELITFIHDLNVDEKIDLVSLMRLGRGDGELADWEALRSETASDFQPRDALALVTVPLLSDYLEEALSQFGESCEGLDAERL
jgi:hypothetical protein